MLSYLISSTSIKTQFFLPMLLTKLASTLTDLFLDVLFGLVNAYLFVGESAGGWESAPYR